MVEGQGGSLLEQVKEKLRLKQGEPGADAVTTRPSLEARDSAVIAGLQAKNITSVGFIDDYQSTQFDQMNSNQIQGSGLAELARAEDFVSMAKALNKLSSAKVIDTLVAMNSVGQETKVSVGSLAGDTVTLLKAVADNKVLYDEDIPDVMGLKKMFRVYQDLQHPKPVV